MKNIRLSIAFVLGLFALLSSSSVLAQQDKSKRVSPPDTVSQQVGNARIVITYSRPMVKGRQIWGALVPFDKVWRTGANEATTFSTDKAVKINGQPLPAGTYGFFTIPGEKEWTLIFNKTAQQWGAYNYKSEDDVLRVKATPSAKPDMTEQFTITVTPEGKASLLWEKLRVDFTITP